MFMRTGAILLFATVAFGQTNAPTTSPDTSAMLGFQNSAAEAKLDQEFLQVPSATLAGEELKILTAAPHIAGSKEDYATAEYVAQKFRAAGLTTKIVPYRIMMNLPKKIQVTAFSADGKQLMSGPTPEHVSDDPYQDDKRIVTAFNAYSPSGDVNAEVVYANYGRPQDFAELEAQHISVRGKIVIVRYGQNFRGVKVYVAQQHGAAGVIIYSDPADDGYVRGDIYPDGPYRPETGVQRGSVQYLFKYPGDPTTPGFASTPNLPVGKRISLEDATDQAKIPSTPLSYHDAAPILAALKGPDSPRSWQGGLPFTYHLGPGPVKVHMVLDQDYELHTIWDVIGKIPGTEYPDDWVIVGNHRDAWTFGAVDPNSGTAAMLEAVHGVGTLLQHGWKPKRTLMFASWDAEEPGLIGSTEWAEDHAAELAHADGYFNIDVGVSGPNFTAGAVPSLKPFLVSIAKRVPSPQGGTVFDAWLREQQKKPAEHPNEDQPAEDLQKTLPRLDGIHIEDLGSGSDYTPFLQHLGVPSTDIESSGHYGVYHSAFDNYAWFTKFADPTFVYLQQQARFLGLEGMTMADADLLPYDYQVYGSQVVGYLQASQLKATNAGMQSLDFAPALAAARRFQDAGAKALAAERDPAGPLPEENRILRQAEQDLLSQHGLPNRPWYKHTIYAPGEYTGYAAVVIPGVNEAIDAKDAARASSQLEALTRALDRAAATLNKMP
ncbi:MAG TPA: M28 family metallopeptidase [Acidobacteriaceae bacterium]|nr:M28 family metallopeptidase [Acidobacteriaceae bacterium]